MKLKAYADTIVLIAEVYPDAEVVYSRDDEGDGYKSVHYHPTIFTLVDGEYEIYNSAGEVIVCFFLN